MILNIIFCEPKWSRFVRKRWRISYLRYKLWALCPLTQNGNKSIFAITASYRMNEWKATILKMKYIKIWERDVDRFVCLRKYIVKWNLFSWKYISRVAFDFIFLATFLLIFLWKKKKTLRSLRVHRYGNERNTFFHSILWWSEIRNLKERKNVLEVRLL